MSLELTNQLLNWVDWLINESNHKNWINQIKVKSTKSLELDEPYLS